MARYLFSTLGFGGAQAPSTNFRGTGTRRTTKPAWFPNPTTTALPNLLQHGEMVSRRITRESAGSGIRQQRRHSWRFPRGLKVEHVCCRTRKGTLCLMVSYL